MPNSRAHIKAGALTAAVIAFASNIRKQQELVNNGFQKQIDLKSTLVQSAVHSFIGAVGGVLPDLLEPADHPCHRKIAHSWAVVLSLPRICYAIDTNQDLNVEQREILKSLVYGYGSHLVLDSTTSKSLPLI